MMPFPPADPSTEPLVKTAQDGAWEQVIALLPQSPPAPCYRAALLAMNAHALVPLRMVLPILDRDRRRTLLSVAMATANQPAINTILQAHREDPACTVEFAGLSGAVNWAIRHTPSLLPTVLPTFAAAGVSKEHWRERLLATVAVDSVEALEHLLQAAEPAWRASLIQAAARKACIDDRQATRGHLLPMVNLLSLGKTLCNLKCLAALDALAPHLSRHQCQALVAHAKNQDTPPSALPMLHAMQSGFDLEQATPRASRRKPTGRL